MTDDMKPTEQQDSPSALNDGLGRLVNPYDPTERPTFLPGDKVRDLRDVSRKTWRIVRRTAFFDSEQMTLREVGDDANEWTVIAKYLIPHLAMVAMSMSAVPNAEVTGPPLGAGQTSRPQAGPVD